MFELLETSDWDIFLGPPERAKAETGRADQWVSKRREFPGVAIVNEIMPACLGNSLSVATMIFPERDSAAATW